MVAGMADEEGGGDRARKRGTCQRGRKRKRNEVDLGVEKGGLLRFCSEHTQTGGSRQSPPQDHEESDRAAAMLDKQENVVLE